MWLPQAIPGIFNDLMVYSHYILVNMCVNDILDPNLGAHL